VGRTHSGLHSGQVVSGERLKRESLWGSATMRLIKGIASQRCALCEMSRNGHQIQLEYSIGICALVVRTSKFSAQREHV
jgi:hypothetical protein